MSEIHYSKGADALNHDPRDGDPDNLEHYYNEAGDELLVLTDEREEFEADSSHDLRQDVLNDGQWSEFIEYLGLNKAAEPATKPAHTPGPWAWHKDTDGIIHIGRPLTSGKFTPAWAVATIDNLQREDEANAALIVRAVNSHDGLVAALARTAERLEIVLRAQRFGQDKTFIEDSIATHPDLIVAKTALAKAKGAQP